MIPQHTCFLEQHYVVADDVSEVVFKTFTIYGRLDKQSTIHYCVMFIIEHTLVHVGFIHAKFMHTAQSGTIRQLA